MTTTRVTHCDLVLAALREGPKTASQLYSLGLIAHSRIASLRAKGHRISCTRIKGDGARGFLYTLELDGSLLVSPGGMDLPKPGDTSGADINASVRRDASAALSPDVGVTVSLVSSGTEPNGRQAVEPFVADHRSDVAHTASVPVSSCQLSLNVAA